MHSAALTNVDAEKTVLGCLLLDPGCLYRALPMLRSDDFSLDSHRRIFGAIAELAEAGLPVDDLTLTNALIAKRLLQQVGGVEYVGALTDRVTGELARVTNVEHYAQLLGDRSQRRQAVAAANALIAAAEDPSVPTRDCLLAVQESLLQIESDSAPGACARHVKDILPEVLRELETQATSIGGLVGMPTGLTSLDHATGGIRNGELWTIGALPGKGKTALGIQMLLANGSAKTPSYAFSLEMQGIELGKRFLAARSPVPAMQVRNPQSIRPERWLELAETAAEISSWPIYIDDRSSIKISELCASARLYVRRYGVRLVVVDYLRLVEAPGRDAVDQVGYVANALRKLAKTEQIGVLLLSQLRKPERAGSNIKPNYLDLKDSNDIAAHSHVVLLPHLPLADDGRTIPEEQLLIVAKNRNGALGSLPIYFDERRLQFFDREVGRTNA
jgi:replicative DNA helicase